MNWHPEGRAQAKVYGQLHDRSHAFAQIQSDMTRSFAEGLNQAKSEYRKTSDAIDAEFRDPMNQNCNVAEAGGDKYEASCKQLKSKKNTKIERTKSVYIAQAAKLASQFRTRLIQEFTLDQKVMESTKTTLINAKGAIYQSEITLLSLTENMALVTLVNLNREIIEFAGSGAKIKRFSLIFCSI